MKERNINFVFRGKFHEFMTTKMQDWVDRGAPTKNSLKFALINMLKYKLHIPLTTLSMTSYLVQTDHKNALHYNFEEKYCKEFQTPYSTAPCINT